MLILCSEAGVCEVAGGECTGIQVPMGHYHKLVCLEDGSVIFEAKDGPYEPISPADIL